MNVAVAPSWTDWLIGSVVTTGSVSTVKVAALLGVAPQPLSKTARYCLPLSPAAVANESVVDVAHGMSVKPEPLFTCHCTVGDGDPVAPEVNVAVPPTQTVWVVGCGLIVIPEQPIDRL